MCIGGWRPCAWAAATPSRWPLRGNFEAMSQTAENNPIIRTIGVVGAGTMGHGIAQVAARAGYQVVLRDVKDEFLERGMSAVDKSLQRDVDKGRLEEQEKRAIISRIQTATEMGALGEADLVVEAVTEDVEVKRDVFRHLDELTRPAAILASNTSS